MTFKKLIENGVQDLRYGVRGLSKNLGFTFAVIATIALGIGATTAVFSVVYGVTLRPLPYPQPEQLVGIWTKFARSSDRNVAGVTNYRDWRAENTAVEENWLKQL